MTVERVDLSISSSPERMEPVSPTPAVQGQSSPGKEEGKQRRRSAPPEAGAQETLEPDNEKAQHRVDNLA